MYRTELQCSAKRLITETCRKLNFSGTLTVQVIFHKLRFQLRQIS